MESSSDSEMTTTYSPFRDYLGLAGLLARLHGAETSPPMGGESGQGLGRTRSKEPCRLSSNGAECLLSTRELTEDDVFLDFTLNGVDADDDDVEDQEEGGFMPFTVPATSTGIRGGQRNGLAVGHQGRGRHQFCVFCKNNGETPRVYESHVLKDVSGKTTCPILRAYTCPICGENGDMAHTVKYCHLNEATLALSPLKTPRTSTGRRRPSSIRGSVIPL